MLKPRFTFFITQDDGTIFGSAVNPENNEHLAYIISPSGSVIARCESASYELPYEEASYVRFLAGQEYSHHRIANYFTHQRIY